MMNAGIFRLINKAKHLLESSSPSSIEFDDTRICSNPLDLRRSSLRSEERVDGLHGDAKLRSGGESLCYPFRELLLNALLGVTDIC